MRKILKHLRCTHFSYRKTVKTNLIYSNKESCYSIFSKALSCFLLVLSILKLLIIILCLFVLTSCSKPINNIIDYIPYAEIPDNYSLDRVTMTTEKSTYSKSVGTIEVMWNNGTDKELTFGESFHLEKNNDSKWEKVHIDKELVFTAIGLPVSPRSSKSHTYNISAYYGEIESGQYRIATTFSYIRAPGDYDTYSLYAEFSVI